MNYYDITVPNLIRVLTQVKSWLDKAQAFAEQKKFDPETLLTARLAPDQFPLVQQIRAVAYSAKAIPTRLAGQEPPAFDGSDNTIAALRARIDESIEVLRSFKPEQFEGAAERQITVPFDKDKYMTGADLLFQFALPNFYFHATTTYAILRHNGVDLGKRDFLGDITMHAK